MLHSAHYWGAHYVTQKMSAHSPTTSILAKCWILQRNPTLISVSQMALRAIVYRQMLNFLLKSNIAYFANVGFRVNIQHFDPSVLSRQTKPHCGLRQFWGQFCLMLFLDFRTCQTTLKKWSFRSGRFWGRSDRNSFCFDLLPGEKRSRFDLGRCNCLQKNRPATWRNFDVVLVCQTTDHHHNSGGFWNDEARRNSPDYVHFARPGNR